MSKSSSAPLNTDNAASQPASSSNPNNTEYPNIIKPTKIDWQSDDTGNQVPVSGEFGDVYFSHADGLAESRHVFLNYNQLPERLANLAPQQCFTVAELGFGTGLNLLALWQLWRQLRTANPELATSRLHLITTEKHPIPLEDLTQILTLWGQRAPELAELIEQLLAAYPPLITGCHRLDFIKDNLTVDIWLGDAADSLAKLDTTASSQPAPHIDAWFLDGFAPSCNESLWADAIFAQIQRLSSLGTTAATYSCAGIVKRALQDSGFEIKKVPGFGRKREMLTAVMIDNVASADISDKWASRDKKAGFNKKHSFDRENSFDNSNSNRSSVSSNADKSKDEQIVSAKPTHVVVIGAGVSGLMTAWALANRSVKVTLLDKTAPLSGASGNPRALLAPKMTPIHHADDHLHTIGYLYSSRFYRYLNEQAAINNTPPILEPTGAVDLLVKSNVNIKGITDYPDEIAITLPVTQAEDITGLVALDLTENLYLPQSGLVNPQALKNAILKHPLITFRRLEVTQINETEINIGIIGSSYSDNEDESDSTVTIEADSVVICAAYEGHQLDSRIVTCRTIRGQLSWFTPTAEQQADLPKLPLKYSGYCAPFIAQTGDAELNKMLEGQLQFLLGASFVDGDKNISIRSDENQQNRDKLISDIPELDNTIPTDTSLWQARAGIRTQTIDYHPLVGLLAQSKRLWTLSAMGAKGYALAPICAETLADMMLGAFPPLSVAMLAKISPNRVRLHKALD
ncbi:tRNA (5-methylaminomethyl-2-thiouridine)(34)-methyltransferase MnmD [Psychrobacter frigidicola]|uniref:tRNA (5-methylaminomethyl-2-thiouridine)(34)-methyltransferase MnmD n=1 Tax=Psychrobacter frigidicola TaxID=45611 RepID=UPI0019190CA2|nr:tRNA (5-methylaminomethyl-2-thiouridine)(34)-methyltransferase MnmD [Psychrobacter frigidicola]